MENYNLPQQTSIGHVHLKVANLQRAINFYVDLLGFQITTTYGNDACFISAGGYHHHIGLNTWYSKNGRPPMQQNSGLFHTAILYPTKKDLATIYQRVLNSGYPFTGFADHGVSLALYLNDPDENGVELYWDRPREYWPKTEDGSLQMFTKELILADLLKELD